MQYDRFELIVSNGFYKSNRVSLLSVMFQIQIVTFHYHRIQSQTAAADGFALYKIAFMWYCPLGALLMWTSGIMISHLTGGQDLKQLDLNLMSPAIKYLLPGKYRHMHLQMDEIKSLSYVKDRAGNDGV